MPNHKYYLFILCTVIFFGCASVKTPSNWLPEPENVPDDPYGSWVEAEYFNNDNAVNIINGELIAIDSDSLYLLNDSFRSISLFNIKSARLVKYNSNAETMANLTVLGCISTISNGWLLIVSSPFWLIGGITSTAMRSFEPLVDYPEHKLSEFAPYARFPQGLPKDINKKYFYPKDFIRPVITSRGTAR